MRSLIVLLAFAGLSSATEADMTRARPRPHAQTAAEQEAYKAFLERVDAALKAGTADPAGDAGAAAARGAFGLITMGDGGRGGFGVPGVICFTPYRAPPEVVGHFPRGDVIDEAAMRLTEYAATYNRALVGHAGYRDADLCRAETDADRKVRPRTMAVDVAARPISRPPASLQEAARRGSVADVRHWLERVAVDTPDGFGMTALAWAIARGNDAAVEILLRAGANPWSGRSENSVYWAARYGRGTWFARLVSLAGRGFETWPANFVAAAAAGGDAGTARRILAEPHEPLRIELLDTPLPAAEALAPFIEDGRNAEILLMRAIEWGGDEGRPDLVRLALEKGANADTRGHGYDTALGAAAKPWLGQSSAIVDLLLRAGADPNLMSHRTRPIWVAIGALRLGMKDAALDERAYAMVDRLRAGGADINLADYLGRPGAWALFCPTTYSPEEVDTGVKQDVVEALAARGLDLNAEWQGKRLLTLVEAQLGRDAPLAVTLRRLGARG